MRLSVLSQLKAFKDGQLSPRLDDLLTLGYRNVILGTIRRWILFFTGHMHSHSKQNDEDNEGHLRKSHFGRATVAVAERLQEHLLPA